MGSKDDGLGLPTMERAQAMAAAKMSSDTIKAEEKSARECGRPTDITDRTWASR